MWPLVVDTVFTAAGKDSVEPEITGGKPKGVSLMPVAWNVTWTIKRALTGNSDGLKDLIKAQNKIPDVNNGQLQILGGPAITVKILEEEETGEVWSTPADNPPTLSLNGNIVTGSIGEFTKGNDTDSGFDKIGTTGAVNFEMKYVPFNLKEEGRWDNVELEPAVTEGGVPVWIIRNGLNDLAQTDKTDFNSFHHIAGDGETIATPDANGNGAVRFSIAPKTSSTLVVEDGVFVGPANSMTPEITFTTGGYDDEEEADVYYAVAAPGATPGYSDYIPLNPVGPGEDHEEQISLTDVQVGEDCDIYVIIYKDGEVSEPEIINTEEDSVVTEPTWGVEPYMSFYVASYGGDNKPGTKEEPLATAGEALNRLAAAYNQDVSWPGKWTSDARPGAIIILNTVNVAQMIMIDGDTHPPIILRDDDETSGGTLKATAAIGYNNSLLRLDNGARVTLTENLILQGTKSWGDEISGVYVDGGSIFTMTGGTISGYYRYDYDSGSGGVHVTGGSAFTMRDGTISDCKTNVEYCGGGVYVYGSTFTMYGGTISRNEGSSGGGVLVRSSTFIMYGGTISRNEGGSGGGVYLGSGSMFTMTGGEISNNSIYIAGGGVAVWNDCMFTMTGGKISNNVSGSGGGVYVQSATFAMNGGTISENSATNVYGGDGGGVLVGGTFTMTKGEIWGNIAASGRRGGGVFMRSTSLPHRFSKTGGKIYGDDGTNNPKNNKAAQGGHAVYIDDDSSPLFKNTTVGLGDNLYYNDPEHGTSSSWD
jgi:hypothetical protein